MLTSNLESNLLHYNLTVSILQSCKELQNIYCQILVMNVLVSIYSVFISHFATKICFLGNTHHFITICNHTTKQNIYSYKIICGLQMITGISYRAFSDCLNDT